MPRSGRSARCTNATEPFLVTCLHARRPDRASGPSARAAALRAPSFSAESAEHLSAASAAHGGVAQPLRVVARELTGREAPRPVAGGRAGTIHARVAAEPEHVLRRDDRE